MMMQKMAGLGRSFLIYYGIPGRQRRMRRFYSQFIRPGDLCFDVGAHLGNRIRIWRGLGARVVAVEPQPELMRWLQRLYGRSPHVTLLQTAVGAVPGSAILHVSSRNPTVSTLSSEWITAVQQDPSFAAVQWDEQVTVPVTTLSDLIRAYGLPAFCKLDIEGYELEALQGLDAALPALSFEHIPASAHLTTACLRRLQELGDYRFNYSPGETHRLHFEQWLTAEELTRRLPHLPPGSGDVYGRRGEDWRLEIGDWRLGRTRD